MLFINFSPEIKREESLSQIRLGGNYYSKKGLIISCPEYANLNNGLNSKYTIALDANGCPEIVEKSDDSTLYFLLSSEGKDKKRLGNGNVMVLKKQREIFNILLTGDSADVRYGVPCKWNCKLLQLQSDDAVIRVRLGYNLPDEIYIIHNRVVFSSSLDESSSFYTSRGVQMPYKTSAYSLEHDWTSK